VFQVQRAGSIDTINGAVSPCQVVALRPKKPSPDAASLPVQC
jgi:hypothetical protein